MASQLGGLSIPWAGQPTSNRTPQTQAGRSYRHNSAIPKATQRKSTTALAHHMPQLGGPPHLPNRQSWNKPNPVGALERPSLAAKMSRGFRSIPTRQARAGVRVKPRRYPNPLTASRHLTNKLEVLSGVMDALASQSWGCLGLPTMRYSRIAVFPRATGRHRQPSQQGVVRACTNHAD